MADLKLVGRGAVPKTNEVLLARARAMRREMSEPEAKLWSILRDKQLAGVKFAHQVVIDPYIADFVARSRKLVIEVDGDSHAGSEAYDERRTQDLQSRGYRVIRFTNHEVMTNPEGVYMTITAALATAPLPTLSPEGRGL